MKSETERQKENHRRWYKENRQKHLTNVKNKQKKSDYAYEKTPEQKRVRNIKRKTRYYFRLEGHRCEFCGKKATEHHHNTYPIELDKFNYVCHDCHIEKDLEMDSRSKFKKFDVGEKKLKGGEK